MTKEPEKPETTRLHYEVPTPLARRLKTYAAITGVTQKQALIDLLEANLPPLPDTKRR